MAEQSFFDIELLQKRTIARDVLELGFSKPKGFTYDAGQFVQFKIAEGDGFVLRSYSISSIPSDDYLEFCVKLLPHGKASEFFVDLEVGHTAHISIARGMFVCQPAHSPQKVFIATGAGIAPIMSMIRAQVEEIVLARQATSVSRVVSVLNRFFTNTPEVTLPDQSIKLIFGVREEVDLIWYERLTNMVLKTPELEFMQTLSRAGDSWQGKRGRVSEYVPINPKADYYICGSLEMVKDVRTILLDAEIDTKKIHFEIF